MNKVGLTEKIIIVLFLVTTVFVLWLISPMGKLYLPINKKPLEDSLGFKLPEGFIIKNMDINDKPKIFHLYYEKNSPHLISLLIFDNNKLQMAEVNPLTLHNSEMNKFWISTRFVEYQNITCKEVKNKSNNYEICSLECKWPESHHKTEKEGQFALLKTKDKSIVIICTASKKAYDSGVISKLINSILKKA